MNRKIEMILRFMQKNESFWYEITTFLIDERLLKQDQLINVDRPNDRAKFLVEALEQLLKDEVVMLVDWEWNILPVERLKLLIICETMQQEFTFGH